MVIIALYIVSNSCKNNNKSKVITDILPYTDMLQNDIKTVLTTPTALQLYNFDTSGKAIDSTIIDTTLFKQLITTFIQPNIADSTIKNEYIESSFEDEDIGLISFSYDTKNKDLPVKNLIVSFNNGAVKQLKMVLIQKVYTENKKQVMQQLCWNVSKFFTINTTTDSSGIVTNSFKKVTWYL